MPNLLLSHKYTDFEKNVLVSIAKALQTEPQGYARISDEGVLHSLNTFGESIDRVKLEKTDLCSIMQHFPDLTQIEVHSLELLGKMRCDTDTSKEVKIREEDVAKLSSDLPQDAVEGAVPEKVSWFRERHSKLKILHARQLGFCSDVRCESHIECWNNSCDTCIYAPHSRKGYCG